MNISRPQTHKKEKLKNCYSIVIHPVGGFGFLPSFMNLVGKNLRAYHGQWSLHWPDIACHTYLPFAYSPRRTLPIWHNRFDHPEMGKRLPHHLHRQKFRSIRVRIPEPKQNRLFSGHFLQFQRPFHRLSRLILSLLKYLCTVCPSFENVDSTFSLLAYFAADVQFSEAFIFASSVFPHHVNHLFVVFKPPSTILCIPVFYGVVQAKIEFCKVLLRPAKETIPLVNRWRITVFL